MRLGELKNIINQALSDQNTLEYKVENLYEGKRYRIKEFSGLRRALNELVKQNWVNIDYSILKELSIENSNNLDAVEISPDQHNKLGALINGINKSLPIFMGILDSMVEDQDESTVNIKLPVNSIDDFKALSDFNTEVQKVFNLIVKYKGLGGEIKFIGLDVGSHWYKVLILGGPLVYPTFMGILNIAHRAIQLRKEWYASEDIRLTAKIRQEDLNNKQDLKEEDFKDYINTMIEKKIENMVDELVKDLPDNNDKTPLNERKNSFSKGIKQIIDLIGKGTEFHPSLNIPEYIKKGESGRYDIDYEKVRTIVEEKREIQNEPKQIEEN